MSLQHNHLHRDDTLGLWLGLTRFLFVKFLLHSIVAMSDKEDPVDDCESYDSMSSPKKTGQTSLLDSGEDFMILDEEDIDDEPPPLEDAGGGKDKNTESIKEKVEAAPLPANKTEEWLDVLGMFLKLFNKVCKLQI